jgi:membrane protein
LENKGIILNIFAKTLIDLRAVIFFAVLCLFFCFLYYNLSGKKGKIIHHLCGAVFASVCWLAFTFFYSIYISYSLKMSYLYAGFGAVIFFMLWIYFCVIIVLLGCVINRYLFHIDFFNKTKYN